MGSIDENNFYRLIALLVEVSPNVVRCYFKRHILKGSTFKSYLEKNIHILFHLFSNKNCCQCSPGINGNMKTHLSKQQFNLLFQCKQSGVSCRSQHECICKYTGIDDDDMRVLDLTLSSCVLINCENMITVNYSMYQWMVQLRDVRNEIVHKSDAKSVSSKEFENKWQQLDGVLMGMAAQIDTQYSTEIRIKIDHVKTRSLITENKLNLVIIVNEWCMQKMSEMEKMQEEVKDMITREEQWHRKMEEWLQNSDKKLDKKIEIMNRQIGEISCKLSSDQRSKDVLCHGPNSSSTCDVQEGTRTIPVLLHVEIPSNWDKAQINEGLEKTKLALDLLTGNIRIRYFSTEQLKMLLDVVKYESDVISYEVYRLLEQIIKTSKVDMSVHSSLSAFLHFLAEEDIPSIPDNSFMSSVNVHSEQKKQEGHYIQQRNTASLINEKTAQFAISNQPLKDHKRLVNTSHLGDSIFVVGIDLGTTYSGYTFAPRQDLACEPPKLTKDSWQESKHLPLKTPTAVLLRADQTLKSFGYDAENNYSELLSDGDRESHFYFHQFKTLLHNEIIVQRVTRTTEIKDMTGKPMQAIKVFSLAIGYLKDHLVKEINKLVQKEMIHESLYFVLTVPATWNEAAKQFMRDSAEMAGIKKEKIDILLEPEAASIFCQNFETDFSKTVKAGMKYMVIDLGGETADITVHQRQRNGAIKEVLPPTSGPWGGKSIDKEFSNFLLHICGPEVMEEFRNSEEYIDLFREFETKKRSIKTDQTKKVVIILPVTLTDLVKKQHGKFKTAVGKCRYKLGYVSYAKQKLHISPEAFRDLFKPTIDNLIKHLGELLTDPKLSDLNTVLMVGGFSECKLLQDAVRQKIGKKMKLIIPKEAGLAVLKGAVLFGNRPRIVSEPIARFTYGIQSWPEWNPDIHPENKKVTINGQVRCKDVFFKYITKGERIQPGHEVSQIFQALKPDETTLECTVYTSTDEKPRYITDPSCQRLGILTIQLPPHTPGQTVEVEETLIFGEKEILCRARDLRLGRISEVQFDLL